MNRSTSCAAGAGVVLASVLVVGAAQGAPQRRAGLWDMQVSSPMMGSGMHVQACVGPQESGAGIFHGGGPAGPGGARGGCTGVQPQMSPIPGGMSFHMVCHPSPSMTIDMNGSATGDFNSAYTVRTETHMTPSPQSMGPMVSTVSARWIGACPAGMGPGDTRVNGVVMHRPG